MTDDRSHEEPKAAVSQQNAYSGQEHPDLHEINDWIMYGPKNGEIEILVRNLTLYQGMRLAEVEDAMVAALKSLRADDAEA